uniref:Integrase, catalytic region, zinc finger, CCHC-type, peptidase aspartic, catalytic n=1 Tax=Tanacetum cinerariifolium TaxID=118510 RepID=A0A6L2KXU8_TANCI|nr:hypothetical protein [Tanacetum cinerariifolium]
MFLNVEQLEKQLDKEDFQEIGSMIAFNYTQQAILEFHYTLIQHLESVKKSIDERAHLKREYDSWVNERHTQTTEENVDTSKALDASSVDTESSRTESKEHDTNSRSGNDAHDDGADIRPIYDEEPMAKVQTTAKINVFSIGRQHTEQPEFNNEGEVLQNAEECHDTWKLMLQSHINQLVVRQPTAFKSERPRILEPRFASQVDVNYDLSKPVTIHYLPKEREVASAKPQEAKKKTQKHSRNSEPSLMPSAISQSTANGSKPQPRRNTQTFRNWTSSKSSLATTKTVPIAEHSRNSRNFSDSKHFVCSTCQKCVFSANHDSCVTKFPNKVNSRTKVPSNKTTNINKPVEQITVPNKQERHIPTGHRYLINQGFKEFSTNEQAMTSDHNSSELGLHDHINEQSSSKLVPNVVPPADKTDTSRQELEFDT